jgi:DNA-binding transcriptional MerR regulator
MKLFYSIKEVASLLGETEPTLRFWEKEFPDVIKPKRNELNKVRFYNEEDIEDIRMIQYLLRDCQLTLDGVRKKLKNNPKRMERQAKVVLKLKRIKAELKELGKAMDDLIPQTAKQT